MTHATLTLFLQRTATTLSAGFPKVASATVRSAQSTHGNVTETSIPGTSFPPRSMVVSTPYVQS